MAKRTYMRQVDDEVQAELMLLYAGVWPDERPAGISEKEWDILLAHVRDRQTYAAIGEFYSISRARVHQLAQRAMSKLVGKPYRREI